MKEKVAQLKEQAQSSIESAASLHELEEIRVSLLGKKGELTEISKGMKTLSPEERPMKLENLSVQCWMKKIIS